MQLNYKTGFILEGAKPHRLGQAVPVQWVLAPLSIPVAATCILILKFDVTFIL